MLLLSQVYFTNCMNARSADLRNVPRNTDLREEIKACLKSINCDV